MKAEGMIGKKGGAEKKKKLAASLGGEKKGSGRREGPHFKPDGGFPRKRLAKGRVKS